jgi:predicted molibdopterin-dependent oxidoreductase YjgC
VDAAARLIWPHRRLNGALEPIDWAEAIRTLVERLRAAGPERVGVLLSPKLPNEDLWLARRLFGEVLSVRHLDFRVPPAVPGYEDDFLIRADKNPNTRGAELLGLSARGEEDGRHVLAAAEAGRLAVLWIFGHELHESRWPAEQVRAALERVECVVFQGSLASPTSERAHLLLPSAAWVEREGTYTNVDGRVQRFWKAVEPLGEARPDWDILAEVARGLGQDWRPRRAEHIFRELAAAEPAFAGLGYKTLADHGAPVAAAEVSS